MKCTVLIPTYRRVKDLERCLKAVKLQSVEAYEILVVVRENDRETHSFLDVFSRELFQLKIINVSEPGQVAALNSGLIAAMGDVIAITDDDAAPHADWLERITNHFLDDEQVGGVGGRDWVYENESLQPLSTKSVVAVGKLQWFGRMVGNHHLGTGEPREVDILKGANMSYRRSAISGLRFDKRLQGIGAQVNNDAAFSLSVRRQGWKIIYDPLVAIDHYPAPRLDCDQRSHFDSKSYSNAAYNQSLVMLDNLSKNRSALYFLWAILIGSKGCFGLLQLIRFLYAERNLAVLKLKAAILGHMSAAKDRLSSKYKIPLEY